MALRTPPTPIAQPRASTALSGASLRVLSGRGMTERARHDEERIEHRVRDTEVAEFVEAARPHARRLEFASQHLGPVAHYHALALLALIDKLGRRWGSGPEAA